MAVVFFQVDLADDSIWEYRKKIAFNIKDDGFIDKSNDELIKTFVDPTLPGSFGKYAAQLKRQSLVERDENDPSWDSRKHIKHAKNSNLVPSQLTNRDIRNKEIRTEFD